MAAQGQQQGVEGLSRLAHALRRSTALHVAAQITPAGSTVDDLLSTADTLAAWIRSGVPDPAQESRLDNPPFPTR